MAKNATKKIAKETETAINIHEFVGEQIKKLRGNMSHTDFGNRYGVKAQTILGAEEGKPLCIYTVKYLAEKVGKDIAFFFPNGEVPSDYPEH